MLTVLGMCVCIHVSGVPSQWNPVSNLEGGSPRTVRCLTWEWVYMFCVDRSVHRGVSVFLLHICLFYWSTPRVEK